MQILLKLFIFLAEFGFTVGSCLDCYRGMEVCLFSGQCVEVDKKYVTVAALRSLIARDCPIKNAGPCPKARPSSVASTDPCVCPVSPVPEVKCVEQVMQATQSPPCECPTPAIEIVRPILLPRVATTTAPTTLSTCESDLKRCERSLVFTDTSKAGAQTSRQDWKTKYDQSQLLVEGVNFTKVQYQNRSSDLSVEVRKCHENLRKSNERVTELTEGWRSTNASLSQSEMDESNATSMWDQCLQDKVDCEILSDQRRVNLTVLDGLLTTSERSDEECQNLLPGLNRKITGKILYDLMSRLMSGLRILLS